MRSRVRARSRHVSLTAPGRPARARSETEKAVAVAVGAWLQEGENFTKPANQVMVQSAGVDPDALMQSIADNCRGGQIKWSDDMVEQNKKLFESYDKWREGAVSKKGDGLGV